MTWEKLCKALACCGGTEAEDAPAAAPNDNRPQIRPQTLVTGTASTGAAQPATGAAAAVVNPPAAASATVPPTNGVYVSKIGHTYNGSTAELLFNMDRNRESVTEVPVGASAATLK